MGAAPLLGFRTEFDNLAVLVIPLAFIFAIVYDRWNRIGNSLTLLLLLMVFLVPWALSLFASPWLAANSAEIIYLFFPVFTVLGLYWIRWWAIRPPRVWADSFKA